MAKYKINPRFALKSADGLTALLDELSSNRGPALALLFDSIVAIDGKHSKALRSAGTRLELLSADILKTAGPSDLRLWLASLRLRKWLGVPFRPSTEPPTSVKLRGVDMRHWSGSDLALAVEIFRLESDKDAVIKCICAAFGKCLELRRLYQS